MLVTLSDIRRVFIETITPKQAGFLTIEYYTFLFLQMRKIMLDINFRQWCNINIGNCLICEKEVYFYGKDEKTAGRGV